MNTRALSVIVCALLIAASAIAHAQARRDRVFLRDLEGVWVEEKYADALQKSRMPHAVAKRIEPLVIAIRREGRSFPMLVTNFDRAAVQAVLDVEPDKKPGSYRLVLAPDDQPISSEKVQYLWFKGERNAEGRFEVLEMAELFFRKGKWASYRNVGAALGPFVNGAVIAGRYRDAEGRSWEFSKQGEAYLPDETFPYELSLNDKRANCEYLEGDDLKALDGKRRIGFAWKNDRLELYKATMVNKRVRCEAKPFAVLTPQRQGA